LDEVRNLLIIIELSATLFH